MADPSHPTTNGDGDAYDPMKDPERRPRRSNDPGWNYGYWLKPGNNNVVVCNLCGKVTSGGIKRHKEHLAATGGDATGCPKASTQLRREMLEYLEKNKRNIGLPDDDEDAVVEVDGTGETVPVQGSSTRPSSGTAAKRNKKAFAVKISGKKCQAHVATKSIVSMLRRKPEDVVDERRSGCSQSTMESSTKTPEERHYVSMQWALFFYECDIPFNVASSRQFQIAIEASCQYGPGYKPPSPHELREPLLRDCVKETKLLRKKHEVAWKQYGKKDERNGSYVGSTTSKIKKFLELSGGINRIFELEELLHAAQRDTPLPSSAISTASEEIILFHEVDIVTASQKLLASKLSCNVVQGKSLLLTGPNGTGKSSVFRVLRDLWPAFSGRVTKPSEGMFHVPQSPYTSLGTLRDQVIYPLSRDEAEMKILSLYKAGNRASAPELLDDHLKTVLVNVRLVYLLEREGWDSTLNWEDILSLGEQQRLGMARLFFHHPKFGILDECTNATSVDVEEHLYRLATNMGITVITSSQRPALIPFHSVELKLIDGEGNWELCEIQH